MVTDTASCDASWRAVDAELEGSCCAEAVGDSRLSVAD